MELRVLSPSKQTLNINTDLLYGGAVTTFGSVVNSIRASGVNTIIYLKYPDGYSYSQYPLPVWSTLVEITEQNMDYRNKRKPILTYDPRHPSMGSRHQQEMYAPQNPTIGSRHQLEMYDPQNPSMGLSQPLEISATGVDDIFTFLNEPTIENTSTSPHPQYSPISLTSPQTNTEQFPDTSDDEGEEAEADEENEVEIIETSILQPNDYKSKRLKVKLPKRNKGDLIQDAQIMCGGGALLPQNHTTAVGTPSHSHGHTRPQNHTPAVGTPSHSHGHTRPQNHTPAVGTPSHSHGPNPPQNHTPAVGTPSHSHNGLTLLPPAISNSHRPSRRRGDRVNPIYTNNSHAGSTRSRSPAGSVISVSSAGSARSRVSNLDRLADAERTTNNYYAMATNSTRSNRHVSFQQNLRMFDSSNVLFSGSDLRINLNYHNQQKISSLKPNIYICEASLKVTTKLIQNGTDNPNYTIKLTHVLKDFIKTVTLSILNRAFFKFEDLHKAMKDLTDEKKREALKMCILSGSILGYTQIDDPIISIKWEDMMVWVKEMALLLEGEAVRMALLQQRSTHQETLINVSRQLNSKLEKKLEENYEHLLHLFQRISTTSDLFLFLLFGVNVTRREDCIIYLDAIGKSILMTWTKMASFPTTVNRPADLPRVLWSLPFAYCTKLNGFGAVQPEMFDEEDTPVSLEDYFNEAMEAEM